MTGWWLRVEVDWWIRSSKLGLVRLALGPGRTGPRANGGFSKGNNLDDLSRLFAKCCTHRNWAAGRGLISMVVMLLLCSWRGLTLNIITKGHHQHSRRRPPHLSPCQQSRASLEISSFRNFLHSMTE